MEGWWTWILSILTGAVGIYYYLYKNANYFKNKGIPYVKATPLLGNMEPHVFKKLSIAENAQRLYNMRPDVKYLGVLEFTSPVVMLRDPELIKSVAVKNFDHFRDHKVFKDETVEPFFSKNLVFLHGERWREMRSILSPAFTSSKMKMMYNLVSQCGVELADYLTAEASQPIELDMKDIFTRYTNDVIATSAFGISVNSLKDRKNEFYSMGRKATDFRGLWILKLFITRVSPFLAKLLRIKLFENDVVEFFNRVISSTVAKRTEEGIVRNDMIQLMIQAQSKNGQMELSTADMTSQAFIFFIGGFDTTSTLISFAAYSLAINPSIQKQLQAEIDAILAEAQDEVSYETLHGMRYLNAVVEETLRLYSPNVMTDRLCTKTFELPPAAPGLAPYTMEPGSQVWLPIFAIHRDPKYFPDPEKFDPERFSEKNKGSLSQSAYFPFGLGPRACIGNRFALMEAKVALFHLFANCNLSPCSKTSIPIKIDPENFTITSKNGFWLTIQRRS